MYLTQEFLYWARYKDIIMLCRFGHQRTIFDDNEQIYKCSIKGTNYHETQLVYIIYRYASLNDGDTFAEMHR
jgi:hypothetical protein